MSNGKTPKEIETNTYFFKKYTDNNLDRNSFEFSNEFVLKDFLNKESGYSKTELNPIYNYHTLFFLAGNNDFNSIIKFKKILGTNILNQSLTDNLLEFKDRTFEINGKKIYTYKEWNALMTAIYNKNTINNNISFILTVINLLFNGEIDNLNKIIDLKRLSGSSNLSLLCKIEGRDDFSKGKINTFNFLNFVSNNTTPFHTIVINGLKELSGLDGFIEDNLKINQQNTEENKTIKIKFITNNPFLFLMKTIIDNIKKVNIQIDQVDDWGMTPLYFMCYYYANKFQEKQKDLHKLKANFLLKLISKMIKAGANMFVDTFIKSSKFLGWSNNKKIAEYLDIPRPYDLIVAGVNYRYENLNNATLGNDKQYLFEIIKNTRNMNNINNNSKYKTLTMNIKLNFKERADAAVKRAEAARKQATEAEAKAKAEAEKAQAALPEGAEHVAVQAAVQAAQKAAQKAAEYSPKAAEAAEKTAEAAEAAKKTEKAPEAREAVHNAENFASLAEEFAQTAKTEARKAIHQANIVKRLIQQQQPPRLTPPPPPPVPPSSQGGGSKKKVLKNNSKKNKVKKNK
jgi:hypothetical protein